MSAKTGITSIKRFTYRGDATEEWSNQYWFKGAPPTTLSAWQTVAAEIAGAERTCFTPGCSIVAFYGYDDNADNAHAVFAWDESTGFVPYPGTFATTNPHMAGDQAGMVEWKTTAKNSRGKWIYLRKYLHAGAVQVSSTDLIDATLKNDYAVYAGFIQNYHGGLTARKNDYTIVEPLPSQYVTTRTLHRRGKRPLVP